MRSGSETEWLSEAFTADITQIAQWRPPSGSAAFGVGPALTALPSRRVLTYFSFLKKVLLRVVRLPTGQWT